MKIIEGFEIRDGGSGIYIVEATGALAESGRFPNAFQMGLSGAFLWDQLSQRDCSRAELIFALESFYDSEVDTDRIGADVDMFVAFLEQQNLLESV